MNNRVPLKNAAVSDFLLKLEADYYLYAVRNGYELVIPMDDLHEGIITDDGVSKIINKLKDMRLDPHLTIGNIRGEKCSTIFIPATFELDSHMLTYEGFITRVSHVGKKYVNNMSNDHYSHVGVLESYPHVNIIKLPSTDAVALTRDKDRVTLHLKRTNDGIAIAKFINNNFGD